MEQNVTTNENARLEEELKQLIRRNSVMMEDLRLVRSLQLPQAYVAAGYIRNYIWDLLHGYEGRGTHNDIDLVYYDPVHTDEACDLELEQQLIRATGNPKWSVKNQARMHTANGNDPYTSTWDALSYWPEVVTAIGAALTDADEIALCAPYGVEDLFSMTVRRCPLFTDEAYYQKRIRTKEWRKQWPLLTIITD